MSFDASPVYGQVLQQSARECCKQAKNTIAGKTDMTRLWNNAVVFIFCLSVDDWNEEVRWCCSPGTNGAPLRALSTTAPHRQSAASTVVDSALIPFRSPLSIRRCTFAY